MTTNINNTTTADRALAEALSGAADQTAVRGYDGFVGELTFAKRLYKRFLWDKNPVRLQIEHSRKHFLVQLIKQLAADMKEREKYRKVIGLTGLHPPLHISFGKSTPPQNRQLIVYYY